MTRPVGAIRPVLRKYIILPRAVFIVVFSHTSERTGCLVLAPRSPRPDSPSASRQTKSPSPSGGRGLPSHPGVGGPPRPRPSPPAPRPGLEYLRAYPRARPATASSVPRRPRRPGRRTLRTRLRTRLGPLRTRLLRRSPETRACHPRDRTRPRPRRPGRDRTRPPVIPGVYPGTPPNIPPGYPDPRRGIPSRVANRELRVADDAAPPDPAARGVDATPPRTRVSNVPRAPPRAPRSCGGTPNAATCSGVHNSLSSATKRSSRHDDPAAHRLLKSRRARQSIFRWSGRVTSAGGAGRPAARRRSARSGAAMASFAADQN